LNKRIFLSSPHMSKQGYEREYIDEAFETNWIAPLGPNVDRFEKELSVYVGVQHAAALTSGTAAIHLALKSLGVGEGDIVFCSSLTFSGSVNPVLYEKAIPVFIDSDYNTWNMSPEALKKAYEKYPNPKAVIVVNLYGQAADFEEIRKITNQYNTPIIEDAAESLGATYKGEQTGKFGDISIFSFNGNKIITTSGGGMLVCNDNDIVKKVRFWATQARDVAPWYQHSEIGYNYRMSNISAGIGRGQLRVLNERINKKKQIFEQYKEAFKDIPEIEMMSIFDKGEPNYWLTCILINGTCNIKAMDIYSELVKENIESRPIWKPMHLQPIFAENPFYSTNNQRISVSEDIFNRGLCLPSDTKMTIEEQDFIINRIQNIFGK